MRPAFRFLVLLLALIALVAWGASEFMTRQEYRWAERDLSSRARLVLRGARDGLAARLAAGQQDRIRSFLDDLVRDERLLGAAVCAPGGDALQSTPLPEGLGCSDVRPHAEGATVDEVRRLPSGSVHVSLQPVRDDDGTPRGELLLVHDLSWVDRRVAETRNATFLALAVVGLLGAATTLLVARVSWRSWTEELRRLLATPARGQGRRAVPASERFEPFLADVRDLVSRLASEEAGVAGGSWNPERLRTVLRTRLHGEGVVVVANREPYAHRLEPDGSVRVLRPASGLVTALEPVLKACSGTWIAHGSGTADRQTVDAHDRIRVPPGEGAYTLRRVWLSPEEERGYYYGFSNEGLWPLCHIAHTRPEFRTEDWEHYRAANARFAAAVTEEAPGPDPIVLVQDYHFALLPRLLRELRPRATILTFWHIPWPNAERLGICPMRREVLQGLLGSSILGFHTAAHANNFLEGIDRTLEARVDRERSAVTFGGRETLVRAYPISVDWPSRWLDGAPSVEECRTSLRRDCGLPPDALVCVGVDRLDYTKGIVERILAVERLLTRSPELVGRFFHVVLAAPSRSLIDAYRRIEQEVESAAARVNVTFGDGGRGPIVLLRHHHEPPDVFRAYRGADVCYVASLHDGMNLVAKEFVSARDDLRGVLVLSRFTGAAHELTEALLVNPYDVDESAGALAAALAMPPAEQEERMRSMRTIVGELNVYRWAGRMLLDAARLRQQDRLSDRLWAARRAVAAT